MLLKLHWKDFSVRYLWFYLFLLEILRDVLMKIIYSVFFLSENVITQTKAQTTTEFELV